jgi:hypothetical protein
MQREERGKKEDQEDQELERGSGQRVEVPRGEPEGPYPQLSIPDLPDLPFSPLH